MSSNLTLSAISLHMLSLPHIFALIAILLWSSLASLAFQLRAVPPFFLTGFALSLGAIPLTLYFWQKKIYHVNLNYLVGSFLGIFGYHALLFSAFRLAPAVQVNLMNYSWPTFLILFSAIFTREAQLKKINLIGLFLATAGGLVLLGQNDWEITPQRGLGLGLALLAAVTWGLYSVRVRKFKTEQNLGYVLGLSGLTAIAIGNFFETLPTNGSQFFIQFLFIGLGPLGLAFLFWEMACKQGNPKTVGALSFLTPILSTLFLAVFANQSLYLKDGIALTLLVMGSILTARRS